MQLVETDFAARQSVDPGLQGRRDVQMRLIRTPETGPRMPVIDQKFLVAMVEKAIFVHPRRNLQPRAEPNRRRGDGVKDVGDVQKESTWPTNG